MVHKLKGGKKGCYKGAKSLYASMKQNLKGFYECTQIKVEDFESLYLKIKDIVYTLFCYLVTLQEFSQMRKMSDEECACNN